MHTTRAALHNIMCLQMLYHYFLPLLYIHFVGHYHIRCLLQVLVRLRRFHPHYHRFLLNYHPKNGFFFYRCVHLKFNYLDRWFDARLLAINILCSIELLNTLSELFIFVS